MKLYGIANCNTVKKARSWLDQQGVAYQFHDLKKHGLDPELAKAWLQQLGWEKLLNRNGLTWRALSDQQKQAIHNSTTVLQLMLDKPSVIKRPLLELDDKLLYAGFDDAAYNKIFNS